MASPSNNRNSSARKTGGKAGGRAGRPSRPIAGTRDRTVRVPKEWNAQVMDPTNNRGGNQRPTGGKAGGRAGLPGGRIARPPQRPSATGPVRPSIGNVSGPASSPKRPAALAAKSPATPPKPGLRARLGKAMDWVAGNTPEQQARVPKSNRLIDAITGDSPRSTRPRVPMRGANALRGAARGIGPAALYGAAEAGRDALLRGAGMNDRQIRGVTAIDRALTSGGASLAGDLKSAARRLPQTPSGPNSRRGAAPTPSRGGGAPKVEPVRSRFAGARDEAIAKARKIQGSPVVGSKQSPASSAPSRSGSTPSRGTGFSSSSTRLQIRSQATAKPAERRVSAATANRESGNYGTSGTDNKLIDSWMRDRMRQRESAANEAAMTDAEKSKLAEINKKKKEQKK